MRSLDWALGRDLPPARLARTRRAFLGALGLVHVAAFASLWVQVHGLVGEGGLLPARDLLERARGSLGGAPWLRLPTLCWWAAGDAALHGLCAAGVLLGLVVAAGRAPRWALLGLWVGYLSLVNVGDVFLGYQWDALLLEATLLGALWAPPALRPRWDAEPRSRVPHWLLRWLVFRVLFLSGVVKLTSGDPTWRDLSALEFHYWTQPLPHAWSHAAHHLPVWWHRASAAAMFAVELALPCLYFGPRRLRWLAAAGTAGLLLAIMATGNYGFFEPLVLVLCLTLLDDEALRRLVPRRWRWDGAPPGPAAPEDGGRSAGLRRPGARAVALGIFAAFALTVTVTVGLRRAGALERYPRPLGTLVRWTAPLHSFNAYGLFAVMTTTRNEITLEGSADGLEWRPYVFRWKPGPPDRRPGWTGVHMPRLDWQMWFAALRHWQRAPWYSALALRLLEGAPAVRALLAEDPFPDAPPRYLRATIAETRFSTPAERRGGRWWQAGPRRTYAPTFELRDGRLYPSTVGMLR